MAAHDIEWCNRPGTVGQSWNPFVGCARVSEGCRHCYAEVMAARIANAAAARLRRGEAVTNTQRAYMRAVKWEGGEVGVGKALPRWSGNIELVAEVLAQPLRWRMPRTVFPSMTDPFHEALSNEQIVAMFGVMAVFPQHTFLILTKRPERAVQWFEWVGVWPPRNVWLGTSVENQDTADQRIGHLLRCPAIVRFLSYEPGLGGPVDFGFQCCPRRPSRWVYLPHPVHGDFPWSGTFAAAGLYRAESNPHGALAIRTEYGLLGIKPAEFECLPRLDWIIVGGESGPGARPFDVAWARSTVEQCRAAGVPCFVKQLGALPFAVEGSVAARNWPNGEPGIGFMDDCGQVHLRDRKGGDWSEWPEDLRVRQWPEVAA